MQEAATQTALGDIVNDGWKLEEQKKEYNAKIKKIDAQLDVIRDTIMLRLDTDKSTMSKTATAKAVLTEVDIPVPADWDTILEYIHEHKAFHLLQRRLNTTACRETNVAEGLIPGTKIFQRRAIALTKA